MLSLLPCSSPAWQAPVWEDQSVSQLTSSCVPARSHEATVGMSPSRIARWTTAWASPSISRKNSPGTSVGSTPAARRACRPTTLRCHGASSSIERMPISVVVTRLRISAVKNAPQKPLIVIPLSSWPASSTIPALRINTPMPNVSTVNGSAKRISSGQMIAFSSAITIAAPITPSGPSVIETPGRIQAERNSAAIVETSVSRPRPNMPRPRASFSSALSVVRAGTGTRAILPETTSAGAYPCASMTRFPYPAHPLTPYAPMIVTAALTGIAPTRARVPHVPLSAEEIVADAERCFAAGAAVVHVHVRDADERPAWRRAAYAEVIGEIRRRCPAIVVCATTSGRAGGSVEERADVLGLGGAERPDLASLTLGSLNFAAAASVNEIATVEELARRMAEHGVVPELEIFDVGMAHLAHRLERDGLLPAGCPANLLLGFPNSAPADARSLVALIEGLPAAVGSWAAAGYGAYQQPAGALAAAMGGNVRTGLEDNPYLDHVARTPATNSGLVARAVAQAHAAGRAVATAAQARELLRLAPARPALAAAAP